MLRKNKMHHTKSIFLFQNMVDLFRNSAEAGWRGCFRLEKKKSVICGDIHRPRSHELFRTWTGIEDNLFLLSGKSYQNLPFRFTSRFLSIIWSLVIFQKNAQCSILQSCSTFQTTWPTTNLTFQLNDSIHIFHFAYMFLHCRACAKTGGEATMTSWKSLLNLLYSGVSI